MATGAPVRLPSRRSPQPLNKVQRDSVGRYRGACTTTLQTSSSTTQYSRRGLDSYLYRNCKSRGIDVPADQPLDGNVSTIQARSNLKEEVGTYQ